MNEQPQTPEYKAEYDKAVAELDAQERPRGADGKFVAKTEETPAATLPETKDKPAEKVVDKPVVEAKTEAPDPMAELRAEIARLDKVAKDNQAWGTRNAQELAALRKEREDTARKAARPKILDANPELEAAVRYVAGAPKPDEEAPDTRVAKWKQSVEEVHPGIFDKDLPNKDPELYKALEARMQAVGIEQWSNPFVAIREITSEKLAHSQRQADKRLADEIEKVTRKGAMSVPGSGTTATGSNADADAVARIRNMSDAEFEKERRKALGY